MPKKLSIKPYPPAIINEAKRLWMRGYSFKRIIRLPQMPNRIPTLMEWSQKEDWEGQLVEIKVKARELFISKMAEEFADEDVEQMRLLLKAGEHIERNFDEFKLIPPQALNALASALDKNVKGRRLVSGEVTDRQDHTGNLHVSWEDIIYATASAEDDQTVNGTNSAGLSEEV